MGTPLRTTYLGSRLISMRSGCATSMPWRASLTTSSTWLISFFTSAPRFKGGHGAHGAPRLVRLVAWLPLLPAAGPLDGLLPLGPSLGSLLVAPARLPGAVHLPVLSQFVQASPEAHRETGGVGRPERGGLTDRRTHERRPKDVGLELHQEVVHDHAAVDLERLHGDAGVLLHGLGHVKRLVADGLQRRPHEVAAVDVARKANDRAPRVRVPGRREEAREGGNEVGAARGLHL